MTPTRENLLTALRALKKKGVHNGAQGLCHNVTRMLCKGVVGQAVHADCTIVVTCLARYWKDWPEYSGYAQYPVPADRTFEFNPMRAFTDTRNMWDRETEYGAARWRLLAYLIATLEKELAT